MGQLIGLMLVTFYKSGRSGLSAHEKRQRQDAEASAAWLDTIFPVHKSDADESVDGVEETDFSPAHAAVVVIAAPTGCLDSDCVTECDVCKFGGAKPRRVRQPKVQMDLSDVRTLLKKYGGYAHDPYPPLNPVFQSRHEMGNELYATASTLRGRRASVELRATEQMMRF